jgi:hypothetical protein
MRAFARQVKRFTKFLILFCFSLAIRFVKCYSMFMQAGNGPTLRGATRLSSPLARRIFPWPRLPLTPFFPL